jgi:hypothetical protein
VVGSGWRHRGIYFKDDCDFDLKPHHFTFVATKDMTSRELGHHRVADADARMIYTSATIVNGKALANNRSLINQGVSVEKVAAVTHTEIRKIAIRDLPAGSGPVNGMQHAEPGNGAVYRHELQAPSQSPTVVAQKVNERHPAVVHPMIPVKPAQQVQPVQQNQQANQSDKRADKPAGGPSYQKAR